MTGLQIFLLCLLILLEISKTPRKKQGQNECMTRFLMWYDRDSAEQLFEKLPIFVNQCAYLDIRPNFERISDDFGKHFDFWNRGKSECNIVFASRNSSDSSLEENVKEKIDNCHVVKINPINVGNSKLIEIIPLNLVLEAENELDHGSIDIQTLTSIILKRNYIEALHIDESIAYIDFWKYFRGIDFSEHFPVCQITVTLPHPKTRNDLTDFWNFVAIFLIDLRVKLVSSQKISRDLITVQFYNWRHRNCYI
ncbi:unnamed protein product [Caenorhabditis angaria]|uniref:Receptor L-domain domain-containing protein n=1 Tax=Caenorhabditis angaria TaxID=860376 RepID=A0A9P1IY09_9PELO|nr:unnamed protein product [Caenorhabditis angaria]